MEKKEYLKNAYDMIYLVSCSINNIKPDKTKIEKMDLNVIFKICQRHILTACVAYALESIDIHNNNFIQAKEKAIRKNIIMDKERENILNRLEQEHIWYMPLKGSIIKDWYPRLGMRQMSDNDILCDGSKRKRIKHIMKEMGFVCERFEKGDDAYHKPPVSNFEMHNELFSLVHDKKLHEYYKNVKLKLIKDKDNEYGYHFQMEDFYVYMIAHEYKHYSEGGTGVRSLLDTYIFLRKFNDTLDWDYIFAELKKLDIIAYEKQSRELAIKLFKKKSLTEKEKKILERYILSGSYGTIDNGIYSNFEKLSDGSKAKYIFRRFFPPMDEINVQWNFFYRHKLLIPILWIYRPIHAILTNWKKIKKEIKFLKEK